MLTLKGKYYMRKLVLKIVKLNRFAAIELLEVKNIIQSTSINYCNDIMNFYILGAYRVTPVLAIPREIAEYTSTVDHLYFGSNHERDKAINRLIENITNEQFRNYTSGDNLKLGEYYVVTDKSGLITRRRKLIAILPEGYTERYICEDGTDSKSSCAWASIEPIISSSLTIDGEIYTWEQK